MSMTSIDDPRREIRLGLALAGAFAFAGVGWAGVARLDAAATAPGIVKVSGERQAVQSLSGGIVSALHVREGDRVRAGQLLVEFAAAEPGAQERALAARAIGLQTEIARLHAERLGHDRITPPAALLALVGADAVEARRALAMEQAELDARLQADRAADAVLAQRIVQVEDQIAGTARRQASNQRQRAINDEELTSLEALLKRGYTTKTRVLALRRQAASLEGETGAQTAEIARLRNSAGETRLQIMAERNGRAKENAQRLREAEAALQEVLPQWAMARAQLDRTRLRAPAAGSVVGLGIHTVGGVAAPGAMLMEIVPDDRSVLIEAQLPTSSAADVRVGQLAQVHLLAMHGGDPMIDGAVAGVSADSLTDPRSGQSHYAARIRIPGAALARFREKGGSSGALKPGAPVQVAIALRKRTALQYWLEPLTGWFWSSLKES